MAKTSRTLNGNVYKSTDYYQRIIQCIAFCHSNDYRHVSEPKVTPARDPERLEHAVLHSLEKAYGQGHRASQIKAHVTGEAGEKQANKAEPTRKANLGK
jgi:hypothetical protein